jgi:hypothetical protein
VIARVNRNLRELAKVCKRQQLGGTGLELTPLEHSKIAISASGGTESGTLNTPNTPQPPKDPDLIMVVEHWPNIPPNIKAAIMALIQNTT